MNKSSSVLINRRTNRTVFANIVEQRKAIAEGKQLRIAYITDNTNSILATLETGAVETTVAEYERYSDDPVQAQAQGPVQPAAPTILAADVSNGQIIITFTEPDAGGSPILNYEYSVNDGTSYSVFSPDSGPVKDFAVGGLVTGTIYSVRIRAVNSIGPGEESDHVYITQLPGTGLQLLLDGSFIEDASSNLWRDTSGKTKNGTLHDSPTWTSDNSGAYIFDGINDHVTVSSGFSDFTKGLTILAFVNFGTAANSWERILDFGQGPEYNNILFTRSGTSSDLRFQIYNGLNQSISLNTVLSSGIIENAWGFYVARLDGATYLLRNQNASTSGSTAVLPANVTRTLNYIGRSNWADPYFEGRMGVVAVYNTALSNADISGFFDTYKARYLPAKPTGLSATAGDGEVSISFTAGSNNGSAITNYQYSTDNGASYSVFSPADTTSPVVISGLTNGVTYSIKLRSVNAMGTGAASDTVTATPVSSVPTGNLYTSPTTNISVATVSSPTPSPIGGNVYEFNGTSDYLSISGDNAWAFGTGDFTIEWFQYQTDNSTFPRIFAIGSYPSTSIGCSIEGGLFYAWFPGASSFGSPVPYKNTWVHFAIVRSSGVLRVYKNGTQLGGNISNTSNITNNSTTLYIGVENGGSSNTWFGGYLTNIRIVKGLAVYTGNFTTPTSSLTLTASANPYGGSNTVAIPAGFTKLLLVP